MQPRTRRVKSIIAARAALKNARIKPNATEEWFTNWLELCFPGVYEFNGGQVIIEALVPDYFCKLPTQKKLIEIVGRRDFANHSDEAMARKKAIYEKYGFSMLELDSKEIKDSEKLVAIIAKFTYGTMQ